MQNNYKYNIDHLYGAVTLGTKLKKYLRDTGEQRLIDDTIREMLTAYSDNDEDNERSV